MNINKSSQARSSQNSTSELSRAHTFGTPTNLTCQKMSVEVTRVFVGKDSWRFRPFAANNLTRRDDYLPEDLDVRLYVSPQFCRNTRKWINKSLCIIFDHKGDTAHTIAFAAVVRT